MKKVRGKALALVLSLALVVSSFSTAFTSAASRTLKGDLSFTGGDDEFYFVNGKENEEKLFNLGTKLGTPEIETPDHENANDIKITDISHKSGDHVVKWYGSSDGKDSIDDDTDYGDVYVKLRNASSSGEEVLSVLYSGSYTDDDDKEYNVRASKDVTIRVYDKNEVVLGEPKNNPDDIGTKGEYEDNFAQKTTNFSDGYYHGESKTLTALKATVDPDSLQVEWVALKTGKYEGHEDLTDKTTDETDAADEDYEDVEYLLDSSSDNLEIADGSQGAVNYTYKYVVADDAVTDADGFTKDVATNNVITLTDADKAEGKVLSVGAFNGDELVGSASFDYKAEQTAEPATVTGTDAGKFKIDADSGELWLATADTDNTYKVGDAEVKTDDGPVASKVADADSKEITVTVTPTSGTATETTLTLTYVPAVPEGAAGYQTTDKDETNKKPGITVASGNVTVNPLENTAAVNPTGTVNVSVKEKAGASSLTLTLKSTKYLQNKDEAAENSTETNAEKDYVFDTDDVDLKTKIEKKILVQDATYNKIGKDGSTYLYKDSLDDAKESDGDAIKANGFEIKFDAGSDVSVTVDDKADVEKISGAVKKISVDGDSSIDEIATDDTVAPEVDVSEAEVGDIAFDDDAKGKVYTDSHESEVGNITDASEVHVDNGKVGNIDAEDKVEIKADDEDYDVTVGDVETKELTIDSEDSKGIKTGTLKANSDDSEFDITGDAVTIGGIDYDYYGADVSLEDFQGEIPAPKNATDDDATLSTNNEDDRVTVKGDADLGNLSVYEESQIAFDGALNVANVDGSGKLVIAPGKLYVSSDASDVQLVLNGSFKVGDVAYTSAHDTIDEDSFDNYGYTVTKTEGSDKDTFKIASTEFRGLTIAPATVEIAKDKSQTFTASAYAPGSAIPEGYSIKFAFDGDDQYFTAVDNGDGTATVTVKDVDATFASLNKATLTAYLEDADGATNDEYSDGEADIKAVAVPATNFKSDTTGNVPLKVGQTYQFKITSLDGTAPTFGVAGNGATVQFAGATGSDYFYKVTGAKEGSYGVYVNGGGVEHRAAILVIKGVNVTTDTTAVTRAPGQTYQFKITAPSQPNFGAVGLKSVLASKSGNNYFYKVTASNVKGGHGIYVNGVRVAIFTVA